MIQQNVLPFKVEITKDTITPHAGLALLGEFTMALGLLDSADRYFTRLGSAAYQAEIINYCEGNDIKVLVGSDLNKAVLSVIRSILEGNWEPYKNGHITDTVHSMNKTKEAFRLIYKPQVFCDPEALSEKYVCSRRCHFKIHRYSHQ